MKKSLAFLSLAFLAVLVLTGCSGQNQTQEGNQNQEVAVGQNGNGKGNGSQNDDGQAGGPPEEAISACANLSEGDNCSFTMTKNNGDEEERGGTCQANPKDETLTCMSGDMQGPGGPGGVNPNDIQK